ncbi:MAG: hypothetical protein ACR2PK_01345, partial [Acidimicrobiales bacterium]
PPIIMGMAAAVAAYLLMGFTWDPDTSYWLIAVQLGVLGAGLGLVTAPTSSAVVDSAPAEKRGAAAATLMVVRLLGLSVGLSLLTAWGLARFNDLRTEIDLPPIADPEFEEAVLDAQASLTAQAIAETFLAAAVVTAIGLILAFFMTERATTSGSVTAPTAMPTNDLNSPTSETGVPMSWIQRHSLAVVGVLAGFVVLAFVFIAILFTQLSDTEDRLDQASEDLARVEAGAALFASQVTGFQEQLVELEPTISAGLDEAIAGLDEFATSTIEFDVNIDEQVTIDTAIVLDREIVVPIKETLPIQESFDTTIEIDTPLGFSVPLDVTVPVDIQVPIDLEVEIPVNETVPVNTTVPVQLDLPIAIDVAGTELAGLAESLSEGLTSLQGILSGLGG